MDVTDLTLDQLPLGETATVVNLTCQGIARRRMMDLGLLPGVRVTAELQSPLGDPVAYRIRDAVIALRRVQARQISIDLETKSVETKEVEHAA